MEEMSRVERKKLEKEMKKSNKVFKFKKESSAPVKNVSASENKMKSHNPKATNERKEDIIKDGLSGTINKGDSDVHITKQVVGGLDVDKDVQLDSTKKIYSANKNEAITRAITADKIVSLEDERMYFERRQREKGMGVSSSQFMTVDDIITLEDEENGVIVIPEENINDEVDIGENINEVKKIHIESAPFEDVVRVAESRLQAKENVGEEELNMEESKKNEESGKLLKSVDSVNKANIDDLYESLDNKNESESKSNMNQPQKEGNEVKKYMKKGDEGTVTKKPGKNGGGFKKFLLGALGIIIVVYVLGCFFFNGRYYANTKI